MPDFDLDRFKRHVEDFLNETFAARILSERCRDYVNNRQWTSDQLATLRQRKQAPIVVNRVKPKVEGLKGLLIQRKTDPRAYPRTQKHEEAAHAVTDALRYVADNVKFDDIKVAVAGDYFVEGYGGAIVEVKQSGDEMEIEVKRIPWDRIYFDPHSRREDFKDATYMGVVIWMDLDKAREIFGDKIDDGVMDATESETFEDRPRWASGDEKRKRVRIAQEYYLDGDTWNLVIFTGDRVLLGPQPSPMLDEQGEPTNPIELVSAYIDRDNRRFGEVAYWLDLQDEINHRRSKALHANSNRQTAGRKGAVKDIPAMKRELAKFDGHVEYEGEKGDFEILDTGDMAQAQFALLEQATAELDAVGFNAQLAGERQGNLSGKAILALQGAGANEIGPLLSGITTWENRIYRQIWYRIRQFWTAERWIRVTDDERNLRWAGFNVPMTTQQLLEEKVNDEGEDEATRKQAAELLLEMTQAQDPRLAQVHEVRNPVAELDVDIMLDQSLDTINVQAEQFELLANLATNRPEVPFVALLRLSTLRDKDDLIEKIEEGEKAQGELLQAQVESENQKIQAQMQADIARDQAKVENELQKNLILNQQKIEAAERLKAIELSFEAEKSRLAMVETEERARIDGSINRDTAQVISMPDAVRFAESVDNLAERQRADTLAVAALLEAIEKPREVQRDAEGRVVALV